MTEKKNNTLIHEALCAYLSRHSWDFHSHHPDFYELKTEGLGRVGVLNSLIYVRPADFLVTTFLPLKADPHNREEMLRLGEYLHRVNISLFSGNFELDYDDGEIRYKCFCDCNGAAPTDGMIADTLLCGILMASRYSQGISNVIFYGKDPKSEAELCESGVDLSEGA